MKYRKGERLFTIIPSVSARQRLEIRAQFLRLEWMPGSQSSAPLETVCPNGEVARKRSAPQEDNTENPSMPEPSFLTHETESPFKISEAFSLSQDSFQLSQLCSLNIPEKDKKSVIGASPLHQKIREKKSHRRRHISNSSNINR